MRGALSYDPFTAIRVSSDASACWPFEGRQIDRKGYGRYSRSLMHRLAWERANGRRVPEGMHVLHSCDNPPCCNPAHLRVGTNDDNIAERMERGRSRNGSHLTRGEGHGRAKLTNSDVAAIRSSSERQRTLAARYGVSQSTIWRAIHGVTQFEVLV